MAKEKPDKKADIKAASDRGETVSAMEPLLLREDLATGDLLSQALLGPGVRSSDPGVSEQVREGLARVREQVGLD